MILKRWISVLGVPKTWHKDGGKEFNNELLSQLSQYFGIKETTTPAYSPWFNGVNERNHATIDRMIVMMQAELPELPLEECLFWAVHAFNTLESSRGFSPMQLMIGTNSTIPTLGSSVPALLPEVSSDKGIRDNLNALHEARKAKVRCESDKVLKEARSKRIRCSTEQYLRNDWVYMKQKSKKFKGPYRIVQSDGKTLWIDQGQIFFPDRR